MAFEHAPFFFDYKSFKDELLSLSNEISNGNVDHLSLLVQNIRKMVRDPEQWILSNKGTYLSNMGFDQKIEYRNALIGHWLLIILSKYLSPAKPLGYRWTRLFLLLRTLEWKEKDVQAVIFGNSVAALICTEYKESARKSVKWTDPYWMWIRPERSIYSGWLSIEELSSFKKRLKTVLKTLVDNGAFFPGQLNAHQFTREEVTNLLTTIIRNYEIAESKNLGVYSIVYEGDG